MQQDWDIETQLVVVGAGACGLIAAYAAARRGVEVVLLEKDTRLGNNIELSSGSIAAAGTRLQRAAGIHDTPEQMADDVLRKNDGQADRELTLSLCRKAPEVVSLFVDELGVELFLNTDAGRAGQSSLRLHNPAGRSGALLVRALFDALGKLSNVTFADRTPCAGLATDEQGAVTGVMADAQGTTRIRAQKVILACAGFGSNKEMLRCYIPEMADVEYLGAQTSTGDGIQWAMALGAATDNMTGYMANGLICPGYGTRLPPETPRLGGVIVNIEGKRFCREDLSYSELAGEILKQPRRVAVLVFDQRIHDILAPNIHFRETIDAGALRFGNTLAELATALKLDPERLHASVAQCSASVGEDRSRPGREGCGLSLQPPFYGAYITAALLETQGGLKVDVCGRVVREDGTFIPNLYAGGSTVAGVSGSSGTGYLSGNGLLVALSLGLTAGEHAAAAIESQRRRPI